MSEPSNSRVKYAIDEYEGVTRADSSITTLVASGKELLAMRAAKRSDAERVRSVVREAALTLLTERKLYVVKPQQPTMGEIAIEAYGHGKACDAAALLGDDLAELLQSIAARATEQLAGVVVGLSSSDRVRLQSIIGLLRKQPVCWDMESALLYRLLASPTEPDLLATGCPVHYGQIHGGEAEELRAGIEVLVERGEGTVRDLQALIDRVDARDSLAHLETADLRSGILALIADDTLTAEALRKAMAELVGLR